MIEWTEDQKLARVIADRFGDDVWASGWGDEVANFVAEHAKGPAPVPGRLYDWKPGPVVRAVQAVHAGPEFWVVVLTADPDADPFVVRVEDLSGPVDGDPYPTGGRLARALGEPYGPDTELF